MYLFISSVIQAKGICPAAQKHTSGNQQRLLLQQLTLTPTQIRCKRSLWVVYLLLCCVTQIPRGGPHQGALISMASFETTVGKAPVKFQSCQHLAVDYIAIQDIRQPLYIFFFVMYNGF